MSQLDRTQLTSQTPCYVDITEMLSTSRREIKAGNKTLNCFLEKKPQPLVFRSNVLKDFVFLFIPSSIHSIGMSYMLCTGMLWSYIQHVGSIQTCFV